MVNVSLDELDTVGKEVELTPEVAAALAGTGLVAVTPSLVGRWVITPVGKVGAVRVSDVQIQVDPKERVGVGHLLFLLGYAKNPAFREEDVEGAVDDELWPALGYALARQVRQALLRGVLQGYRTVDESLRTVRGKVRIVDQITTRPGRWLPIEVTHDEFTVDTVENRILRSALRRMLGVPGLDPKLRQELLHLDGRLVGVGVLRLGSPVPRWLPSRMNERYQPALRLSEVVLRNASAEPRAGGLTVSAFVVSMPQLFEEFVTTAIQEAIAGQPGRTRSQYPAYLDIEGKDLHVGRLPMKVDVVHVDTHGRPLVAFDAKYKASRDSGGYPTADYYQMLAYCTALDIPRAWLVYAEGDRGVVRRQIVHTEKEVVEVPLDLAAPPRDLLARVAEIATMAIPAEAGTR